ncbi:MAG: TrmJ/YjtD family RNA methyltransferase [Nitrospinota bacterium]|nr:TrmJ/YjtD family RNA methyltransferase [Nitrospinota bacterium]
MPAATGRPHLNIILCQARHAGNIGAVARLMKNLGFSRLTLVDPTSRGHLEAMRMASGAEEIIENSTIVDGLEEALEAAGRAYAVTRRPRSIRKKILTPESAARQIATLAEMEVALVFGSEKFGLSTEHVRMCDAVITIPTSDEAPAMNLAQAAAVTLYSVARSRLSPPVAAEEAPSTRADRRILFARMEEGLQAAGYFRTRGARQTMADIEDVMNRASLTRRDVDLFMGMFRRLLAAMEK